MPPCSTKSKYKNDANYHCDETTGRYKLNKGLKKSAPADAPKKPNSGYLLFSSAKRPEVLAQEPTLAPKLIVSRLASMWKQLGEDAKSPYLAQAEKLKAQYAEKMKSYGTVTKSIVVVPKKSRKGVSSAYNLFTKGSWAALKSANPSIKLPEGSKLLSAKWNEMSVEDKAPWFVAATTAPAKPAKIKVAKKVKA